MEYHEPTPSILLIHDGELANLAPLIGSLGGIERRGNPTDADRNTIWDVAIASASRMLELHQHLPETSAIRIAVMEGDSKTLRKMLYRVDTDLLVRQPVHPAALRLLILHALYRGPEKRRNTRVSVGASVRFRIGLRRRNAILAELSHRGCRLIAEPGSHRASPDKLVTVILPAEVTGDSRPLSLRGHVMRVSQVEPATDAVAVLFELLKPPERKRLESIVSAHSQGPAMLDNALAHAPQRAPVVAAQHNQQPPGEQAQQVSPCAQREIASPASSESEDVSASERRTQRRHALSRRIIALGDEAARVLIGRDLSIGGMRIDATPGLALGDKLKVAVHIRPDGQPLVVSAEIARDDGPDGMALRFVDLNSAAQACLEEMVDALPRILEANGSHDGAGVVVSEVIGRERLDSPSGS